MRTPHRFLLGDACDRKRLTGEPRQQDVVVGHIFGWKWHDVADQRMAIAEILEIGALTEPVPLAREDAFAAMGIETHAEPAYPREQVDRSESSAFSIRLTWRSPMLVHDSCSRQ